MSAERSLTGRVALITGATGGIGQSIAETLAHQGARLHLLGRDQRKLDSLTAALGSAIIDAAAIDFDDLGSLERYARALSGRRPELQSLIHCAAGFSRKRISDVTDAESEALFRVNALAPMRLTATLLPALRAGRADVVFINSTAVLQTSAGLSAYAMSKAALESFASTLRAEENVHGLRVLTLFVGRTATSMQETLAASEGIAFEPERLIQPSEIAHLVASALALGPHAELTSLHVRPRTPPR